MKEFGFRQAIVVDAEGVVVVGHTRLLAAKQLGLKVVPVHVAADLSPAQARPIASPTTAPTRRPPGTRICSRWRSAKLASLDYDIDVLGFESDELAELLAQPTVGLVDPDEVPEAPAEPITQPGDIWLSRKSPPALRRLHRRRRRGAADGRRARHPDGHRPALSGRLRRRQPPANLGQRRQEARAPPMPAPSTGTATSTTTLASSSTRTSSDRTARAR